MKEEHCAYLESSQKREITQLVRINKENREHKFYSLSSLYIRLEQKQSISYYLNREITIRRAPYCPYYLFPSNNFNNEASKYIRIFPFKPFYRLFYLFFIETRFIKILLRLKMPKLINIGHIQVYQHPILIWK